MHRAGKWLIRITVTAILFLLFSGSALAYMDWKTEIGCPSLCGEKVTGRWRDDVVTLSVPGCWDITAVTLEMEGEEVLLLGEEQIPLKCGEPVDLSGMVGQRMRIRNEKGQPRGYLAVQQGSRIPALFLEVDARNLSRVNLDRNKELTEGCVVYEEADGAVSYDGALQQLKCRGNNTFLYSKKPYQLKLAEKTSLSGMGKGKTWVLLANWNDVSQLRNRIVLDLCREVDLRNAVGCVPVDIWINGSYHGLYLMTEKIQISKGRIDIANLEKATEKVNPEPFDAGPLQGKKSADFPLMRSYPRVSDPEDITGGYIFTVEKPARLKGYKKPGFKTKNDLSIRIKEPTCPSTGQTEYLAQRVSEMQQALMTPEGVNPMTGKHYREYLDADSFARKMLIEDLSKNYDLIGGSQYMYKDSDLTDPLIYAGPAWDYDLSFGNMRDRGAAADTPYVTTYRRNQNLYLLLYNHEEFRELTGLIWQKDFRPAMEILLGEREAEPDGIIRPLDEYIDGISASAAMNYKRWSVSTNTTQAAAAGSFDNAVEFLRRWITQRVEWMNGNYTTEKVTDEE